MSYIGSTPITQSFISGTDYFNGTGAQTAFTLSRTVASVNDIQAVVNNVVQVPNDAYTISGTTITFTSAPSAGTSNVYVRYLSTTTQAITPSQGTVSWNTLDSNVQGDLGISFKNRIINSNMAIDQRNAGASLTNNGSSQYSVDRWRQNSSQASKFTVQQNAGSVTPPAGFTNYLGFTTTSAVTIAASDYFWFGTTIEGYNSADLNWGTANGKTVTVSFWAYASIVGSYSLLLKSGSGTYSYATSFSLTNASTWQYITVTIPPLIVGGAINTTNGSGIQVNFSLGMGSTYYTSTANTWLNGDFYALNGTVNTIATNGATFYITGVQLEVGTQATTFTTAGGSYGAELALCQRYFETVGCGGIGISRGGTAPGATMSFKFQTSKRITNPTVSVNVATDIYAPATAVYSATSWSGTNFSSNAGITGDINTATTTATLGTSVQWYGNDNLWISAEL